MDIFHELESYTGIDITQPGMYYQLVDHGSLQHRNRVERILAPIADSRFLDGVLPLCQHGCAHMTFVVVNGPTRGELWDDIHNVMPGAIYRKNEDGTPMSFMEWYQEWIDFSYQWLERNKSQ